MCIVGLTRLRLSVHQPDPPGLMHDDPRLLPPWRGSSFLYGPCPLCAAGQPAWRSIPRAFVIHSCPSADWCVCGCTVSVGRVQSNTPIVLTVVADAELSELSDNAERVAAAVGLRTVVAHTPTRSMWLTAAVVIVDEDGARRCVQAGMPRRDGVFLVGTSEPSASLWLAAIDLGAQQVCVLPTQEAELVHYLSEAVETGRAAPRRGRVIAVTAGRGGGGASVFAAALAQCAGDALLVDLDPCGGGLDLLLGAESTPGVRWPALAAASGRLSWRAVREVLPQQREVSMLSCTRTYHEIDAGAAAAVIEAGRSGGATVVCDLPRQFTSAGLRILETADLVAVVTSCDVRGAAAAAAVTGVLRPANPNIGLVVRGPAPGGLRPGEVGDVAAVPLLATMRPEPMLDQQLNQRGLRVKRRSPLATAARKVLAVLHSGPMDRAA